MLPSLSRIKHGAQKFLCPIPSLVTHCGLGRPVIIFPIRQFCLQAYDALPAANSVETLQTLCSDLLKDPTHIVIILSYFPLCRNCIGLSFLLFSVHQVH